MQGSQVSLRFTLKLETCSMHKALNRCTLSSQSPSASFPDCLGCREDADLNCDLFMYATQAASIGPWVNFTAGLLGKVEPQLLGPGGRCSLLCLVSKGCAHEDFDRHAGGPSGCGLLRQPLRHEEVYRGSDLFGAQTKGGAGAGMEVSTKPLGSRSVAWFDFATKGMHKPRCATWAVYRGFQSQFRYCLQA